MICFAVRQMCLRNCSSVKLPVVLVVHEHFVETLDNIFLVCIPQNRIERVDIQIFQYYRRVAFRQHI